MPRKSRSRKQVVKLVSPPALVVGAVPGAEPPAAPVQLLDIGEGSQEALLESLTPEQAEAKRNKRLSANANERRRMQQINEGFESLREFVNDQNQSLAKGELLKRTVSLVGQLVQENAGLIQKGDELERTLTQKGVNWKQLLVQEKEKASGLHMAAALGLVPTGSNREEPPPSGGSGKRNGRNKRSRKGKEAPVVVLLEPEEEDDGIGLSSASQQFSSQSQSQSASQVKEGEDIDLQMEVADLRYGKVELQAAVEKEQSEKGYLEAQLADLQKRNKALREEAKFKEDKLTRKMGTGGGAAEAETAEEEGADGKKSRNLGDIVEAIRIIEGDDDAEKAKLGEEDDGAETDAASEGSEDTGNALEDGDGQNALEEGSQGSAVVDDGAAAPVGPVGEGEVRIAATQDEFIFPSP